MAVAIRYELLETYGNPPAHGGGWIVGSDGSTAEELRQHLITLYGPRLSSIEDEEGHCLPLRL